MRIFDPFYHDGSNWVPSNGTLAQSNTPAEILANVSTFPVSKGVGGAVQIAHIFQSDVGYDTPSIESISISYKFQFKPDDVNLCIVYGSVLDNSGLPVEGATVRVNSSDKFFNAAFIGPSAKAVTDKFGKFSLTVVETETTNTAVNFTIEYTQKVIQNGREIDQFISSSLRNRIVPNSPSRELSLLAVKAA